MKSIKKMLLGIAFLIISVIGTVLWMAGSIVGAIVFFAGLVLGIFFCVDGYLTPEE